MAAGGSWSVYRDYTFRSGSDRIVRSDDHKAREIAQYLSQNPSYRVALDGPNTECVQSVRTAMIDAGVAANRIQTGSYGDANLRDDRRVTVLVSN